MKEIEFRLFDAADFPLVYFRGRDLAPGYATQWIAEMEALLAYESPFVFVFPDPSGEEAREDRKARTLWLKVNRERLAACCAGIVAVEPDAAKRAVRRAQGMRLSAAFGGLPFKVTVDRAQAEAATRRLFANFP